MNVRTGIGAVISSALISLGGILAAALLVVVLVVSAPGLGRSDTFYWASAVAAIPLHGVMAFAGTRFAARRISGPSGPRAACVAGVGPVAMSLLTQLGVAADGRREWPLLVVCGALVGAAAGFWTASRTAARP